jgi:hypothetical protein
MTGRNRIFTGIAVLVLVGLGIVIILSMLSRSGSPDFLVTAPPSETPTPPPASPTSLPTATVQMVESREPTMTTDFSPSQESETALPVGADVTRTPNVRPTGGSQISSLQATASAMAGLLETPVELEDVTLTAESVEVPVTEPTHENTAGDEPSDTPPPTPIEIAFAPVLIRSNVSGEVIGDGTLRLYAPASVTAAQTVRVELELNVDNAYITPTPQGSDRTAVPRSTQVASPAGTTPTPYVPLVTDQGLPIYQRMGATLSHPVQPRGRGYCALLRMHPVLRIYGWKCGSPSLTWMAKLNFSMCPMRSIVSLSPSIPPQVVSARF